MQEDSYCSDYLNKKSDGISTLPVDENRITLDINRKIENLSKEISELAKTEPDNLKDRVQRLISDEKVEELTMLYGNSKSLSELYLRKDRWSEIVERWRGSSEFEADIRKLNAAGLISIRDGSFFNAKLTDLGQKVAKKAKQEKNLFAQKKANFFMKERVLANLGS